jgi:dihydropteroate synthase
MDHPARGLPALYNAGHMRKQFQWQVGRRSVELGRRMLVMGIVNVTPDSFFDGGVHAEPARAVDHALRLLDEGADIVDVGGESTRPGARVRPEAESLNRLNPESEAPAVGLEEELRRVIPVIAGIKRLRPDALVSVDTYKAAVARAALDAGAEIVNDVSGLGWDTAMPAALAESGCGVVLMHMRGRPEEWQSLPPVGDVIRLVYTELEQCASRAVAAGIGRARLVLDPGFGFGKSYEENYPLLARFEEFERLGYPLLAGTSRKSFVGKAVRRGTGVAPVEERLMGSVAAAVMAMMKGAQIVRVHDVRATVEAAAVVDEVMGTG